MLAPQQREQTIVTESIEEGLDRKQLLEVQRRFSQLNRERLQRTQSALNHRQQRFLDALPLLFHVNHPMLPGYMGQSTPCGLCEYKPDKNILRIGRSFARSFRYQRNAQQQPDIESLFVMGSLGTVAYSRHSDLDIWVCHRADLSRERLLLLKQKCDALEDAAKAMALDCHFFLMNAESFRRGVSQSLSSEASGSTQHVLLLDEFYRTAIWLAGRIPLWWLVPAGREQHYQDYRHQLLNKRFVLERRVIDFGPVPGIPPEEFTGAALWQLYKAISAPYKSLFKLLLLEAYTCAFPGFQPLSLSFKQAVYDGEGNIDELDPYILAYRRIEHYLLQRQENRRLDLVRRCLYFKVNKALSRKPKQPQTSWQRHLLQRLVSEWQWTPETLAELDQRRYWKADKVLRERQALVEELLGSYKTLLAFIHRHQAQATVDPEEFNTLGHKLYASYEQRSGKIDWLNPGIADDLSEANLCFVQDEPEPTTKDKGDSDEMAGASWRVYAQSREQLYGDVNWQQLCPMPLKHGSLMEVILWCHGNGLLTNATRGEFIVGDRANQHYHSSQIHPLIRVLQQWLPVPMAAVPHENFKHRARTTHLLIHVNLGREPDQTLHAKGLYQVSDIDDALGYGELKHNLVKSVDLVTRNSWNEIQCQHFSNGGANLINNNALVLCLRTCLQACLSPTTNHDNLPDIQVHCGSSACGNSIRYRVETLLRDILHCYTGANLPLATRYIFAVEKGFYACQCRAVSDQHVQARLEALNDTQALEVYLERHQASHSPLVFDRYAHNVEDDLRLIAKVSDTRSINVVFEPRENNAELIVLDEQGSLFRGNLPYVDEGALLRSLHHFLRNVIHRQSELGGDFQAQFGVFPIRFYKLCRQGKRAFLEPRHCGSDLTQVPCIAVQASVHSAGLAEARIHLRYRETELRQVEVIEQFFQRARECLHRQYPDAASHPCYITDLDLSDYHLPGLSPNQWQSSHYLRVKVDLEARLTGH